MASIPRSWQGGQPGLSKGKVGGLVSLTPLHCEGETSGQGEPSGLRGLECSPSAPSHPTFQGPGAHRAPDGAKVSLHPHCGVGLLTADTLMETLPSSREMWKHRRPDWSPWQNSSISGTLTQLGSNGLVQEVGFAILK